MMSFIDRLESISKLVKNKTRKMLLLFKRIKFCDFGHIILFLLAILPSIYLKRKRKDIWLVSERKNEARDNGYWFFKYVTQNRSEQDIVYVIDKKSPDFSKVRELGNTITYGTLEHWIYYLAATKIITTQKNGKPNSAVCYVLEVKEIITSKTIFLQHGITKDDSKWLYYINTKFKLFICGSLKEFQFISDRFGYPKDNLGYLGFPRFDELHDTNIIKNRILIMPTWREWIVNENINLNKIDESNIFTKTDYYRYWVELLCNEKFNKYIDKFNLEVIFYPHSEMKKYMKYFNDLNTSVKFASENNYEVQELLKSSELLITDYSSVYFDFIYMKKSILFYQFDYEKYRKHQYQLGYFDYVTNPFGSVSYYSQNIVDKIIELHENNFEVSKKYLETHFEYFPLYDNKNSERIYFKLKEI